MPTLKRAREEIASTRKSKKPKTGKQAKIKESRAPQPVSQLVPDEVDFPRGGGTTLTPLEVKAVRAEGVKEADQELFQDAAEKKTKKRKRMSEVKPTPSVGVGKPSGKVRIEHLNYKRMNVGMKILGQIISVQPLALIVSLPNQLFAHVPITNISSQFTARLESMDEYPDSDNESDGDGAKSSSQVPDLFEMFTPGQYVRAVVTAVHAPGANDMSSLGKTRNEVVRASRRVELSLVPERVNSGVLKADIKAGFTMTGAIQSIEDHGYIVNLGVPEMSGFLSFKDGKGGSNVEAQPRYSVGTLLDVTVSKVSSNGRTCTVTTDPIKFCTSALSEVSNASSILPGELVQALITSIDPVGLNLQVLGFFDGTVEHIHLSPGYTEKTYKVGKTVKARVLYDYSSSPPRFALSLSDHVLNFKVPTIQTEAESGPIHIQSAYPPGAFLDSIKVLRVETERGLFVEVQPGLEGFVHISHISDDHIPSLSASGPYKPGTIHRARVSGHFALDRILQLIMKPSVLEQKVFQVADVHVGEVIKGTIKKLTDTALFVSLSGNLDGVIWPNHYADIALKHPGKRFKPGAKIKCRVLVVDEERNRVSLTAKKTLIESDLPILAKLEDARAGVVTYAVVFKVLEKHMLVEFFNNLKATVSIKEVSDTPVISLSEAYPVGKVVKVRIMVVEPEASRITASIRQATSTSSIVDVSAVEIGDIVEGVVSEVQKDNVVLTLHPTQIRALISVKNLANHRGSSAVHLQATLKPGDKLEDLVVVTRNPDKGLVIVANKPKPKMSLSKILSLDTVIVGQTVMGRVTRHVRNGALVKLGPRIGGILHPTDTSDNYEAGIPFPAVDSILRAAVVEIDRDKKQLRLSTRPSRQFPDQQKPVVDREISSVTDLEQGESVRGFIKSVADHGLFVTIGRNIDARVQIKELFDEYVKDWQPRFKNQQLVKGRILSVDTDEKKVEMSFRTGDLHRSGRTLSLANIEKGQKIEGTIKKIEDYGLFIKIEDSDVTGLCHKSQLSDNKDADVNVALRGFREGDHIKAVILDIDKRRVSLSLKPSYFSEEDFETNYNNNPEKNDKEQGKLGVVENQEQQTSNDHQLEAIDNLESDNDDAMRIDAHAQTHTITLVNTEATKGTTRATPPASMKLQGGFHWSNHEAQSDEEIDASSDDSDVEKPLKKKRRKKEIEQDLTADMHTKVPESNADFERLILGSPNSSYLWIQYMSFQLRLSEVDKAREIARRALKTINFREEQEKMNVWIALLNLENVYGTDETLEITFKDAVCHNDSKTIHLRLASILDQSEKYQKAEEQYKRTCKKFGQSSKVWTLFGEFYLRRGGLEQARGLLPRSLQGLDKRKHLKTISRFAQLEYKHGDPERGKTIFEGIVDSHPKRWDLWSIYIDMEAGQGDIQSLRNLFDRVLSIKMTSHKAKSFFKKWLQLERRIGDDVGAELVKQKAIEWTQKANSS